MLKFFIHRIFSLLLTMAFVSIVVFIVIELPPGDFAESYVALKATSGEVVSQNDVDNMKRLYGLDKPIMERYMNWVKNIVTKGDFGISFKYNRPVLDLIGERISFTTILALTAMFFTYIAAIPIGIYSAMKQYSIGDYIFTFVGYFGLSVPGFLLALVLLFISVNFVGTTVGGIFSPEFMDAPWSIARFVDLFKHIWVAAFVLAVAGTARIIRTVRATMLDEKGKLYVTAARARGVTGTKLLFKYPVRTALNPVVSTMGWELSRVISGAPIVAFVLSIPDMGPLFLDALLSQDMYLAGTLLIFISIITIIGTFLSDILLAVMDPRIRMGVSA